MPTLQALGTTLDVRLDDCPVVEAEFVDAWARCLVDAEPSLTLHATATTMVTLTHAITHQLILARRGELLMLHAGAVANPTTGAAIAYVAPGGTGKTTLTLLLGRRYGYLTDETVAIDPETLAILPYMKPLSVRPQGGVSGPKQEVSPDRAGLLPAPANPTLSTLVLLRRQPGASEFRSTDLDLLTAITEIVPETSSLVDLPAPLHLLADVFTRVGGITLLEYSEASQLIDFVSDRLGLP